MKDNNSLSLQANHMVSLSFVDAPLIGPSVLEFKLVQSSPMLYVDGLGHTLRPEEVAELIRKVSAQKDQVFVLSIPSYRTIRGEAVIAAIQLFADNADSRFGPITVQVNLK